MKADPQALERSTSDSQGCSPVLLVEEDRIRARAPPSKKAEFIRGGPSPTKLKAISMLRKTTSF